MLLGKSRQRYFLSLSLKVRMSTKGKHMGDQRDWQWYQARYEDGSYSGPFATREEAVAEGRDEWGDDDDAGFWVAEATNPPVMLSDWIGADDLIDRADESIFGDDRASCEWDHSIFEASKEQKEDLKARIIAACDEWQKAHGLTFCCSTFEAMRNVEFIPGKPSPEQSN